MTANFLIMWTTVRFWRILLHGISDFGYNFAVRHWIG